MVEEVVLKNGLNAPINEFTRDLQPSHRTVTQWNELLPHGLTCLPASPPSIGLRNMELLWSEFPRIQSKPEKSDMNAKALMQIMLDEKSRFERRAWKEDASRLQGKYRVCSAYIVLAVAQ